MKTELAWVHERMLEFGRQRRRIYTGKLVRKDGTIHEDGWSAMSFVNVMREGGLTGGSGHARQHYPEVYSGYALEVWRVWPAVPIRRKEYLHVHYVVDRDEHGQLMIAKAKADIMGVSRKQYFIEVSEALCYMEGALSASTNSMAVAL